MSEFTIVAEIPPKQEDIQALTKELNEFATPIVGIAGFQLITVMLRDQSGKMIGGLWGYINWNWLNIEIFWLPEYARRKGYGTRILTLAESKALSRGCENVHLNTFSFEARPFYEKFGYKVFATLEDYPQGHQRYFMRKSLV